MWGQVWMLGFVLAQWLLFFIDFKGFFHYVAHSVGSPSSLSPWFIILHLWSTFGPYGDPMVGRGRLPMMLCNMFLHLLWGMRHFIFYMNKNASMGWHCGFDEWCLNIDYHCHHWAHWNKIDFTIDFISWAYCYNCNLVLKSLLLWLIPYRSVSSF